MSIFPLPVFEADADPHHRDGMTDDEIYGRLAPPSTIVVKFGAMRTVAEFPYNGDAKPGCGSKLTARTKRGNHAASEKRHAIRAASRPLRGNSEGRRNEIPWDSQVRSRSRHMYRPLAA